MNRLNVFRDMVWGKGLERDLVDLQRQVDASKMEPISPLPSHRGDGEAGPLESPLLAASLPTFNCRVCRRTLVPMAVYSDGAIDTYEYCHVHYKQRVEEHNFNGLLKACSDNQREERYRR